VLRDGVVGSTVRGGCPSLLSETGSPITDRAQQCAADRTTLRNAVEAYLAETGTLPPDEQALVAHAWLHAPVEAYDVVVTDAAAATFEIATAGARCAATSA
jgi:hypothetical protein